MASEGTRWEVKLRGMGVVGHCPQNPGGWSKVGVPSKQGELLRKCQRGEVWLERRAEAAEGRNIQGRGQDFLVGTGSHRRYLRVAGEGVIDGI